jgi:hypothetical protein
VSEGGRKEGREGGKKDRRKGRRLKFCSFFSLSNIKGKYL